MSFSALASLVLLLVTVQLFGDLSTFAEYDTGLLTIMKFLAYSTPKIVHLVLPFSVCLGILASQAVFARNSEIIAMQSLSVSLVRIYAPFVVVGLLATALMGATSFYLYPLGQKEAEKIQNLSIKKKDVTGSFTLSGGRFKVGHDIYGVENLDVTRGIMTRVTCYRFTGGRLTEVVKAESAGWDGKRWAARGLKTVSLGDRGISEPRTAAYLPLDRRPVDLVMAQTNTEILPMPDLRNYVHQLRESGNSSPTVETVYHGRVSFTLAPLVITLLVIPFGMRFPRAGGIAKGISLGLILGLSYWGFHSALTGLGSTGIVNPMLASWGANIAALAVSFVILFRKRRAVYG